MTLDTAKELLRQEVEFWEKNPGLPVAVSSLRLVYDFLCSIRHVETRFLGDNQQATLK